MTKDELAFLKEIAETLHAENASLRRDRLTKAVYDLREWVRSQDTKPKDASFTVSV